MRIRRTILGTVLVAASCVAAATSGCISSNNQAIPPGADGAIPAEDTGVPLVDGAPLPADAGTDTTVVAPTDSGAGVDAADSAVPQARVRLGWLTAAGASWPASDAGLSLGLDFCVSPHGAGAWQGPLLASAGLATGLQPYAMTAYFSVPAGSDDVRILPAGSVTCDVGTPWPGIDAAADGGSPIQTLTNLPPIAAGTAVTIAISDSVAIDDAGVDGVIVLADETSATAGKASVRFVNVSENSAAATYGMGSGAAFAPLFSNVTPFQRIDPTADPAGYRAIDAVSSIDTTLSSQATNEWAASTVTTLPVAIPTGAVFTTFAIGAPVPPAYQYLLLSCFDGQTAPGVPALSNCTLTSESPSLEYTRFANFLADPSQPAADVCIKYHALPSFVGPLLGGPDAGAGGPSLGPPVGISTPSALSGYFQLAGGFTYDVRYVTPGGDCSTGLGADYLYAAPASGNATVAATGFLVPLGDAAAPTMYDAGPPPDGGPDAGYSAGLASTAMAWVTFGDENSTGSDSVRVIDFAAFNPQPFNLSAASWTFTDIPYGGFGAQGSGFVDVNGYMVVASGGGAFNLTDTIGGASVENLSFSMSTLRVLTFFVYTQDSAGAVGVMMCDDTQYEFSGGLWPCSVLNGG